MDPRTWTCEERVVEAKVLFYRLTKLQAMYGRNPYFFSVHFDALIATFPFAHSYLIISRWGCWFISGVVTVATNPSNARNWEISFKVYTFCCSSGRPLQITTDSLYRLIRNMSDISGNSDLCWGNTNWPWTIVLRRSQATMQNEESLPDDSKSFRRKPQSLLRVIEWLLCTQMRQSQQKSK